MGIGGFAHGFPSVRPAGQLARASVRTLALAASLVGLLLLCPSAGAAPTWLSPASLSEAGGSSFQAEVAVDGGGDAVAVWTRYNGVNDIVQASVRNASGGGWGAPVSLSETGRTATVPQVAVDSSGDAVAVWQRNNGSYFVIQASVRPASTGVWSTPVNLSEAGHEGSRPHVAFNSEGQAVAIWDYYYNGLQRVQVSELASIGGTWSTPVQLSESAWSSSELQLAVGPHGAAAVVWKRENGPNGEFIQAAVRASGTWQAPVEISAAGQNSEQPQIAFDPQGDAMAIWQRYSGSNYTIQTSELPASGGSWSTPVNLSEAGGNALYPQLAFDGQGNATAVWQRNNGSNYIIQASYRPVSSGTWATPVNLSAVGQSGESPDVSVDPQGDAMAIWRRSNGSNSIVQADERPASSGTWEAPANLSQAGQSATEPPKVAFDSAGNAVAAWLRFNGSYAIAQAVGFDGSGPLLQSLSIPTSATAGESLSFSVSPLDVWSALGTTTWSFGDGGTATGLAVAHTYAAAGKYTVTVTGGDALGNTTTSTVQLVVEAGSSGTTNPASGSGTSTASTSSKGASSTTTEVILELYKGPEGLINRHLLRMRAICTGGGCSLSGRASVRLPGLGHTLDLLPAETSLSPGRAGHLFFPVPRSLRRTVRAYLLAHPGYHVHVHFTLAMTAPGQPVQRQAFDLPIWTLPGFR